MRSGCCALGASLARGFPLVPGTSRGPRAASLGSGQSVPGTRWECCSPWCFPFSFLFQVQDIEFTQIEMKVIEGLKIGNECLNKMHQVRVAGAAGPGPAQSPGCWQQPPRRPRSWVDVWLFSSGYVNRRSRKNNR